MAQNNPAFQDDGEISSILAEGFDFDGELHFDKPVLIQGTIKGTVRTESDVFVAADAVLDADLHSRRLSVKGTINGSIEVSERLELFRTARVSGQIKAPDLVMQSGALVNATISMSPVTVTHILEDTEGLI